MKIIFTSFLLVLLWLPDVLAGQFEEIKNSMVILDTATSRRGGILVKFDGITYVITSQDAFCGSIISMKTLSGVILQPKLYEVPEEPIGLLRIKTDFAAPGNLVIEDRKGDCEAYRTDLKMGIISEQAVNISDTNALRFPAENGANVPFLEEVIGSPVFSKDGKLIGAAGCNGYTVNKCDWVWVELSKDLSNRRNELQPLKQVQKWKKVDQTQLFKQCAMLDEAENFLFPYTSVFNTWSGDPYATIPFTPEMPEKMKPVIETQNLMVKEIPVMRRKIQDGSHKMGDTAKNVTAGQFREQNRAIGKRMADFAPFYYKSLSSPNIKWESSYFKKKGEDISSIYKNLYEGLKKDADNCGKIYPPL